MIYYFHEGTIVNNKEGFSTWYAWGIMERKEWKEDRCQVVFSCITNKNYDQASTQFLQEELHKQSSSKKVSPYIPDKFDGLEFKGKF